MRHWDLNPGELVTLSRIPEESRPLHERCGGVLARFRFRTTAVALFERDSDNQMLVLDLMDDGTLQDVAGFTFYIVGRRNTRTIIERPLGEGKTFTRTPRTQEVLRRAAKGGA